MEGGGRVGRNKQERGRMDLSQEAGQAKGAHRRRYRQKMKFQCGAKN